MQMIDHIALGRLNSQLRVVYEVDSDVQEFGLPTSCSVCCTRRNARMALERGFAVALPAWLLWHTNPATIVMSLSAFCAGSTCLPNKKYRKGSAGYAGNTDLSSTFAHPADQIVNTD